MKDTKPILLNRGRVAIVDADKYEELVQHLWSARFVPNKGGKPVFYASRNGWMPDPDNPLRMKKMSIGMHRQVLGYFGDLEVDHINGDSLDNRKENLRIVTPAQNAMNRVLPMRNKLGFTGVSLHSSGKYSSKIRVDGTTYNLGVFDTLEEASEAYKAKAAELHGEYARAA